MNEKASEHRYIPGIDGLRALAVLAVVAYHLNPQWLPGGFVGVDLFFVVSGYVVSRSILDRPWQGAGHFFSHFFARRLARIYPALVVCLVLVAVLHALLIPRAWLNDTATKAGLTAFFGLSNLALVYFDDGYFSPRAEFNPFTHTWSLGVEEQFYLVFAGVWWLLRRQTRALWGILLLSFLASLWWCAQSSVSVPAQAYYLLPSRWWELCAGVMLAHWHLAGGESAGTRAARLVLCVGLGLLAWSVWRASKSSFPYPDALWVVVGSVLCLHAVVSAGPAERMLALASGPLAQVGKWSYSIYLWHWPLIVLFKWTVGLDTPMALASCAALTFLAAWCSYTWVEKPLRGHIMRKHAPARVVWSGVCLITVLAAGVGVVFKLQPWVSLSVTADTATWYPTPSKEQANWKSVPANRAVIYAFGDSHAHMLGETLRGVEATLGRPTRIVTQPGCPVANLLVVPSSACQKFIDQAVQQLLRQRQPGDVVVLSSLRVDRLSDQWGAVPAPDATKAEWARQRLAALRHADELIGRLERGGFVVLISAPLPVFAAPPFRCSDFFNRHNPVCAEGFEQPRSAASQWRAHTMG